MTPSTDSLRERASKWLEPISDGAPAGAPSKHHPLYESVTLEVAKLESPTGDAVRWDEVVRGAGELLQKSTKDLWLASYFAYALYMTEGLPGAITGATLLAELTERYWQGLFPEASRLRSRGLALSWYVERMKHVLPTVQAESTSPAVVEALSSAVSKLAEVSRERLASQGPALGPLLTSLERLRANMPKEAAPPTPAAPTPAPAPAQPAPPPATSTPAPSAEAPASASANPTPATPPPPPAPAAPAPAAAALAAQLPAAPTGELTSAEAAADYLRNIGSSLASASSVLRRANPADPLAYRLLRTGLWLHISQPPSTGANGRTSIPPLPAPLRAKLETLATHSRWAELLDEAESSMAQYRFALDLQRFSAHALASSGPTHAAAREALLLELSSLLKRMPAVVELVAADGSPLSDAATKEWLQREVLAKSPSVSRPIVPAPLPRELETPTQDTASEGETLAQLQARLASATTARARFVARLHMARMCAQSGQLTTARALYEALDAECTAQSLDTWEPALAAACLEGFLTCVTAGKDSPDGLVGDFWIRYRRLAQLDPAAALRVQP
ncbi:type VI secretion system protein TssA [Vitiosangium sp. GDMCC 1.1324]|uniref:type VI secretion system protein TssA n=1 Tax=Vitiosangium sp. (strain GDMCC 1.1324) TaxID=2138576 RepID=UPI000D35F628|nr:type VI secretion system protein TssA [Vitiosangium sp. GDMCC 1.1324]PTL83684.1 type VI secretion system protein TssA [Vitiosangium sp. GDMCC 1.1324]